MHCPRCGTQNREGDRYCVGCGAELPGTGSEPRRKRSLRGRVAALIGTTRRARQLTAATAVALVIAVVAFIALKPSDDGAPNDPYTLAADATCVVAKRHIGTAQRRFFQPGQQGQYAGAIVRIVAEWRAALAGLSPAADQRDDAAALDAALREVEIEAAALARIERQATNRRAVLSRARRVDAATGKAEAEIESMGLQRCAAIRLGSQTAVNP